MARRSRLMRREAGLGALLLDALEGGADIGEAEAVLGADMPVLGHVDGGDALGLDQPIKLVPRHLQGHLNLAGCHHVTLTHTSSVAVLRHMRGT